MSNFQFSKKIALRYLWSRRAEAFVTIITVISVIGVAIGVIVLNMVMSIMTGFEHELQQKIVGTDSHIVIRSLSGKVKAWEDMSETIRSTRGVKSVSPFTYHQALLRVNNRSTGLIIRGIQQDTAAANQLGGFMREKELVDQLFAPPTYAGKSIDGTAQDTELPAIVIGAELSRSMGIFVGAPISLISPNVSSSPFGMVPKFRRFLVVGTYQSGLVEYESGLAYVSLKDAQKFFRMGDAISGFEVRVHDIHAAPEIAHEIRNNLLPFGQGLYAQDWTETNKPLWDALKLEKKVYFIVLLLIIVMASFSIITSLVMIVIEKRKDIAILRTMGASAKSIANIFRIQGAVIGFLGTVLGLIGGYLGCVALREYGFPLDNKIFPVSTVPVRMEPLNFALVGICAFLICFFATVYPARRASRLDPSDVLRYE